MLVNPDLQTIPRCALCYEQSSNPGKRISVPTLLPTESTDASEGANDNKQDPLASYKANFKRGAKINAILRDMRQNKISSADAKEFVQEIGQPAAIEAFEEIFEPKCETPEAVKRKKQRRQTKMVQIEKIEGEENFTKGSIWDDSVFSGRNSKGRALHGGDVENLQKTVCMC